MKLRQSSPNSLPRAASPIRAWRFPLALVAAAATVLSGAAITNAAPPQTIISLTFDDGRASQRAAVTTMNEFGVDGTFYISTGLIGASGYLTRANLASFYAAGHEIAGHTVSHPDLVTLPDAEVRRQACEGRNTLIDWGFPVRSFAYPFASSTPAVETAVRECGFNSARMLGDIQSRFGCQGCPFASTLPPSNPYYTEALDQVENTWTLSDLKRSVTNAERAGGGWVQYTFHDVCATGCQLNVTPTVFRQFISWLVPRAATNNTVVRTVGDVIGGPVQPKVTAPTTPPPTGGNGVVNSSFEEASASGMPNCWMQGGYGTNTPTFSFVSPGRTGSVAGRVSITGYSSGDAKLLQTFDLGSCAPSVTAGHSYSLRAWYTSTSVTQYALYLRTSSGTWQYWTSSPWYHAASAWTEAVWTTPPIPTGYTGLSFGLNIFSNGVITTDDYSIFDAAAAPATTVEAPSTPEQGPQQMGPIEVHSDSDAEASGTPTQ